MIDTKLVATALELPGYRVARSLGVEYSGDKYLRRIWI